MQGRLSATANTRPMLAPLKEMHLHAHAAPLNVRGAVGSNGIRGWAEELLSKEVRIPGHADSHHEDELLEADISFLCLVALAVGGLRAGMLVRGCWRALVPLDLWLRSAWTKSRITHNFVRWGRCFNKRGTSFVVEASVQERLCGGRLAAHRTLGNRASGSSVSAPNAATEFRRD
jgi:hypothetical protein